MVPYEIPPTSHSSAAFGVLLSLIRVLMAEPLASQDALHLVLSHSRSHLTQLETMQPKHYLFVFLVVLHRRLM